MADDRLPALLEEIRERHECVFDAHGRADLIAAINAVRDDAPRLLAALDAVLNLTEPDSETHRDLDGNPEGPVTRVVRCDVIRGAITRALTGSDDG